MKTNYWDLQLKDILEGMNEIGGPDSPDEYLTALEEMKKRIEEQISAIEASREEV